jgi:CBS domain-containing protein
MADGTHCNETIWKRIDMAQYPQSNTANKTSEQGTTSEGERKEKAGAGQSGATEQQIRSAIASSTYQGSETVQQATHARGNTLRQSGAAGAEATRHGAQVAAEATQRGADTLAEGQRQFLEQAAEQFETIGRHMAQTMQESTSTLRDFVLPPATATEGLRDLQEGMASLVNGVVQSNVRASQELLRLSDPSAVFDLQRRFLRDYLDTLMQGTAAVIRATRQVADQSLRPIEARIEQHQQTRGKRRNEDHGVVGDVMSSHVRLAGPEDTVQRATQLMRDEDTGVLPVGEGDRLVGIVTDRDIALRLAAEGKDPARTKVREVMTQDLKYVFEDEDLEHVADNMAEQQVRRLPVVNRDKRVVGVISLGDLARADRSGRYAGRALHGVASAAE